MDFEMTRRSSVAARATIAGATTTALHRRSKSATGTTSSRNTRCSSTLPSTAQRDTIPSVPQIPARFLTGTSTEAKETRIPDSSNRISPLRRPSETSPSNLMERAQHPSQQQLHADYRKGMQRRRPHDDLFLELGNETERDHCHEERDLPTSLTSLRRSMSRASFSSKRRSLPADMMIARPSTSGNTYARPHSRLDSLRASSGIFQQQQQAFQQNNDTSRRSSITRASQYADASSISPRQRARSPDSQAYTRSRRGSSFGTAYSEPRQSFDTAFSEPRHHSRQISLATALEAQESPTESSDQQRTDSSVESQTADTVWDELDELKSRIKKLESGDKKKPSTSSAAASGDSSDRPRTATTAPTTINSSPKQSRKQDLGDPQKDTPSLPAAEQNEGGSISANLHPLLHDALSRSRDGLPPSVFHNLEAVVADALQLAALTGSAAASTTGGVMNERQVRRRVDNLCRNMTDLCISLRDSKPDTPPLVSSPAQLESPAADLPLRRFSRTSNLAIPTPSAGRPMSRLEQRKSSLLGPHALADIANISPRSPHAEMSASEAESTPTHSNRLQPLRRLSAVPSRTTRSRVQLNREEVRGDDDRINRPPSRAFTEYSSSLRVTSRLSSQDRSNQDRSPGAQRRTPSLRESLAARRKYDTPPVLEEDIASPQSRGYLSEQQYNKVPSRTSSINRPKHLIE